MQRIEAGEDSLPKLLRAQWLSAPKAKTNTDIDNCRINIKERTQLQDIKIGDLLYSCVVDFMRLYKTLRLDFGIIDQCQQNFLFCNVCLHFFNRLLIQNSLYFSDFSLIARNILEICLVDRCVTC